MKIRIIHFTGAIALSIIMASCALLTAPLPSRNEASKVCVEYESAFTQQKGTFTDQRDNKTYETVVIGSQTWMAENLNYETEGSKCYGEGSKVRETSEDSRNRSYTTLSPAEIQDNCEKYGRLYDWATVMAFSSNCKTRLDKSCLSQVTAKHKGICPDGWHIPSDDEWTTLTDFVGTNAGTKLKASSNWSICNGSDNYGFAALPGGDGWKDGFGDIGDAGPWWTATGIHGGFTIDYAYKRSMHQNQYTYAQVTRSSTGPASLYSVRCIKD